MVLHNINAHHEFHDLALRLITTILDFLARVGTMLSKWLLMHVMKFYICHHSWRDDLPAVHYPRCILRNQKLEIQVLLKLAIPCRRQSLHIIQVELSLDLIPPRCFVSLNSRRILINDLFFLWPCSHARAVGEAELNAAAVVIVPYSDKFHRHLGDSRQPIITSSSLTSWAKTTVLKHDFLRGNLLFCGIAVVN